MRPKSETLFHFTKSLETLKSILQSGIEPRYCLEDIRWLNAKDLQFIGYAMSCFCDIPLSRVEEHIAFYGPYGIGFTKEWGMKNGLEPVIYISSSGSVLNVIDYLLTLDHKDDEKHTDVCMAFIRNIKPLSGQMRVGGQLVHKDFYQENEWRYAPKTGNILEIESFDTNSNAANLDAKQYRIEIAPADIRYLLVEKDSDIPSLFDFINTQLGTYPLNDLKILQTRITSIETINRDI